MARDFWLLAKAEGDCLASWPEMIIEDRLRMLEQLVIGLGRAMQAQEDAIREIRAELEELHSINDIAMEVGLRR